MNAGLAEFSSVAPSAATPLGQRGRRKGRWPLLVMPLVTVVLFELHTILENFHTVVPGLVYRSGQLRPADLHDRILEYHLRSVINLRGSNPSSRWWREERCLAARLGIHHYDLSIDSLLPPNPKDLGQLIHLLCSCEKPVLIHCKSGIDRTGLLAMICVLLFDPGATPRTAQRQLGLQYGNGWWRQSKTHQEAFLNLYQNWLSEHGHGSSSAASRSGACTRMTHPRNSTTASRR